MLAQMNQPPHFDYKPPSGHFNHHHGGAAMLEPQHDEFGERHDNGHSHYSVHLHHASYSQQHQQWTTNAGSSGLSGLTHFGAFDHHGPEHDDDHDHGEDDHPEEEDDDYGEAGAVTPTGRKRKGSAAASSASNGKKEIFVCPEVHCGKTFPRSFALRRHMRIHTGTKPYQCDFDGCTQRFNTSGNLSRHKRIHSGERPYPCVFASCGKRFNTSTKLKRHMRIHFPDGQSLFHCVQHACTFACDNYKEYVHHQRQHGNPAYAAPVKAGGDENVDHSNLPGRKPARGSAKAIKAKRLPQPRVSKASKAAAAATTAALTGDYLNGLSDRRFDHQSPSTSAASGLSMLMKDAHRESDVDGHEYVDHRRAQLKGHSLDSERPPRLPFPTGAFPSESISSASPMNLNLSSAFGSTYSGRAPPATSAATSGSYYDQNGASSAGFPSASSSSMTSSFPSYMRGAPSEGYSHHGHHSGTSSSYHDSIHFPPLRPEDADDGYDSTSPRAGHQHHQQHQHHHHSQHQGDEGDSSDKYGGYNNVPHAVGPEFTGEELSAVLELMKDS